jgi:hypothetical protein
MSPYYYIKVKPLSNVEEFHYPQQECYFPVKPKNNSKSKHRHTIKSPRPNIAHWVSSWSIWGCIKIICL